MSAATNRPAVRIIFGIFRRRKSDKTVIEGAICYGMPRTIWIDPRATHVGKVLLHELTHIAHPSWCEQAVRAETKKRWTSMTWVQKARLYQMLGTAKIEGQHGKTV